MNLVPEIMKEVFKIVESPYALRNELRLKSRKTHFVRFGTWTATFVGGRAWSSSPSDLKKVNPFSNQKSKIGFLKTALVNFVKLTYNESATWKLPVKCVFLWLLDLEMDLCPCNPWSVSLCDNG